MFIIIITIIIIILIILIILILILIMMCFSHVLKVPRLRGNAEALRLLWILVSTNQYKYRRLINKKRWLFVFPCFFWWSPPFSMFGPWHTWIDQDVFFVSCWDMLTYVDPSDTCCVFLSRYRSQGDVWRFWRKPKRWLLGRVRGVALFGRAPHLGREAIHARDDRRSAGNVRVGNGSLSLYVSCVRKGIRFRYMNIIEHIIT